MCAPDGEAGFFEIDGERGVDRRHRRLQTGFDLTALNQELDPLQADGALAGRDQSQLAHANRRMGALMPTLGQQRTPFHVQSHAMGRDVARLVDHGAVGQDEAHLQPVGRRNQPRQGVGGVGSVEQTGYRSSGGRYPTLATRERPLASHPHQPVADRKA